MAETTAQIEQLMSQRNEEQSTIIVGEPRTAHRRAARHRAAAVHHPAVPAAVTGTSKDVESEAI
jgi:hypothetical protein